MQLIFAECVEVFSLFFILVKQCVPPSAAAIVKNDYMARREDEGEEDNGNNVGGWQSLLSGVVGSLTCYIKKKRGGWRQHRIFP